MIWLQGCSLGCPGCWNPLSHSVEGGMTVEISSVVEWVADLHASRLIDGLTISGGEPMEQAGALLAYLQALRLRVPEISIGMFSGYTERELVIGAFLSRDANPPSHQANLWRAIRFHLDFAVLGRFNGHEVIVNHSFHARHTIQEAMPVFPFAAGTAGFEAAPIRLAGDRLFLDFSATGMRGSTNVQVLRGGETITPIYAGPHP